MDIDQKILNGASDLIKGLLTEHEQSINEAFTENDEILEIKLSARFSFVKGKFKIQTNINFVTERIKDKSTLWYDPDQGQLFEHEFEASTEVGDDNPVDPYFVSEEATG